MKNKKCPNRSHCWDYKSGACDNCDLGDHITKLHKKIDRLKAKNEELIYKLECLLCHATGGLLSKHTYDLRTMESVVTDYVEKCCDEARAEAESEGEWVVTYNNGVWHYDCPFCDNGYAQKAKLPASNYCENCGAKLHEPKAKGGE